MSSRKLVRIIQRREGLALERFVDAWGSLGAQLAEPPELEDHRRSAALPRAYWKREPRFDGARRVIR